MSFGIDFWCRFRFYRSGFQGFMWRAGNAVNLRERAKQGETPPNHSGCLQCPLLRVLTYGCNSTVRGENFSTRVPVSGFIQASGNSEQWKMTGNEDNVGFLATESVVKQFQLSLRGGFVLQCRRFSAQLKLPKHTSNSRASAAVQLKPSTFRSTEYACHRGQG